MPSCVLAYSGGLDTSVILGWLQDERVRRPLRVRRPRPAVRRSSGRPRKGGKCGAKSARIVDAREELCRDFAFPVLQWQAKYEGVYLLGTSIARPLISKVCLAWPARWGPTLMPTGRPARGTTNAVFNWRPRPSIRPCNHRPLAD